MILGNCHAGAGHSPGLSRGSYGVLCQECWQWCCEFVGRPVTTPVVTTVLELWKEQWWRWTMVDGKPVAFVLVDA